MLRRQEGMLRRQEQQHLAEEQMRIAAIIAEKKELEEKLAVMSREASGNLYILYMIYGIMVLQIYQKDANFVNAKCVNTKFQSTFLILVSI